MVHVSGVRYRLKTTKVKLRKEQFGALLYDTENHTYYELNPVGYRLLKSLKNKRCLDELAGFICDHYGLTRETALCDVKKFIDKLSERGLVESFETG